jgi:Dna[CI] antecedent, DciA
MSNDPRPLAELLASGSLADLAREATRRRLATVEIRKLLPPDEATHLVSASTNEAGELVLVMDSPSWAARLRYCVAALPTNKVKIRVVPRGG